MERKFAIAIGALVSVLTACLFFYCYRFACFDVDDVAYLFQARLFASGKLYAPAPPEFNFSPSENINITNGKWYSKYPFGHPLVLSFGVLLGMPWLIPVLLTGLSVFFLFRLVEETYGKRVGLIALALAALSPATTVVGVTFFSEPTSRFILSLFVLSLVLCLKRAGVKREPDRLTLLYAAMAGCCLGFSLNTRTLTCLVFGICGAGLFLFSAVRDKSGVWFVKTAIALILPFVFGVVLFSAWNQLLTGDHRIPTFLAAQPYERLGFGLRARGFEPLPAEVEDFTPAKAFRRLWHDVVPLFGFSTLGWGYFQPVSFEKLSLSAETGLQVLDETGKQGFSIRVIRLASGVVYVHKWGAAESPSKERVYLKALDGYADVCLRLVKRGNEINAYVRQQETEAWQSLGVRNQDLGKVLQVGLYTRAPALWSTLRLYNAYFRVNEDASRRLRTDEFLPSQGNLLPRWYLSDPTPVKRLRSQPKGLETRMRGSSNRRLMGSQHRMYQVVPAADFDVETLISLPLRSEPRSMLWIPALFPLFLALLPLFHASRNRFDCFFFSLVIAAFLAFFFWFYDASDSEITPFEVRYYNEALFLGVLPLLSRAFDLIWKSAGRVRGLLLALAVLLLFNTFWSYYRVFQVMKNWEWLTNRYLEDSLREESKKLVVFLPHSRKAPLGDYPFKPLAEAQVVFYRLGPSPQWRLSEDDITTVRRRFFSDRDAYLYQEFPRKLIRLPDLSQG